MDMSAKERRKHDRIALIRKHFMDRRLIRVHHTIVEGHYERTPDAQLTEHYYDVKHECERRGLL